MKPFTPEPYQREASRWLVEHPHAALFVGMGLGKTAATLYALRDLFADGVIHGALIVAPLRVAKITWPEEVKKWREFAWMKVLVLRGKKDYEEMRRGGYHLYITNYEQLPSLSHYYLAGYRKKHYAFDVVVYDESTKLKNPSSHRARMLRQHLSRVPRRWALTGTPNPNSLLDLWAQVRMIDDGARLGPSYTHYVQTYFQPADYRAYSYVPKEGAREQIYEKLRDLALVLRSKDYLNIPPTITEDVIVTLDENARRVYKTMEKELLLLLGDGREVVALTAAVLVSKLQQIAAGVVYETVEEGAEGDTPWHKLHSVKLDALRKIAEKEKTLLVATNFRHERRMVLDAFPEAVEWHDKILPDWNAGKVKMLVADPRSIGHGLNLQAGGKACCWLSQTYSRELYDQFNARLARKGQDQETIIYRIIAKDTIDESVCMALKEKDAGQQALLTALHNFRLNFLG